MAAIFNYTGYHLTTVGNDAQMHVYDMKTNARLISVEAGQLIILTTIHDGSRVSRVRMSCVLKEPWPTYYRCSNEMGDCTLTKRQCHATVILFLAAIGDTGI